MLSLSLLPYKLVGGVMWHNLLMKRASGMSGQSLNLGMLSRCVCTCTYVTYMYIRMHAGDA